jgi:hypothetical protein
MDTSDKSFTLDNLGGPIWVSKGCEFKSLQPDNNIRLGRQDCHESGARPISEHCGPLGEGAQL